MGTCRVTATWPSSSGSAKWCGYCNSDSICHREFRRQHSECGAGDQYESGDYCAHSNCPGYWGKQTTHTYRKTLKCTLGNSVEKYNIGCGKTAGSTIERYNAGCGLQQGQIISYTISY